MEPYGTTRKDRFYSWFDNNFGRVVTWSGTWIGIVGSLTIPYFARHNIALEQHNELKAAAMGIGPYAVGMLVSYIGARAVCALGKKHEAQRAQPLAETLKNPLKKEELSDLL